MHGNSLPYIVIMWLPSDWRQIGSCIGTRDFVESSGFDEFHGVFPPQVVQPVNRINGFGRKGSPPEGNISTWLDIAVTEIEWWDRDRLIVKDGLEVSESPIDAVGAVTANDCSEGEGCTGGEDGSSQVFLRQEWCDPLGFKEWQLRNCYLKVTRLEINPAIEATVEV